MNEAKPIPIRYSQDERQRLEQAAALAGYKHLSRYIRDKSLDRLGSRGDSAESVEVWSARQALCHDVAELVQGQQTTQVLLTIVLGLLRRKSTAGDLNELRAALVGGLQPQTLLSALVPELAEDLQKYSGQEV